MRCLLCANSGHSSYFGSTLTCCSTTTGSVNANVELKSILREPFCSPLGHQQKTNRYLSVAIRSFRINYGRLNKKTETVSLAEVFCRSSPGVLASVSTRDCARWIRWHVKTNICLKIASFHSPHLIHPARVLGTLTRNHPHYAGRKSLGRI